MNFPPTHYCPRYVGAPGKSVIWALRKANILTPRKTDIIFGWGRTGENFVTLLVKFQVIFG